MLGLAMTNRRNVRKVTTSERWIMTRRFKRIYTFVKNNSLNILYFLYNRLLSTFVFVVTYNL